MNLPPSSSASSSYASKSQHLVFDSARPGSENGEVYVPGGPTIRRIDESGCATLHLSGRIDPATLLEFRDSAFTTIGARPEKMRLDLVQVDPPFEMSTIQSLIAISRVAGLVKVACSVRVSQNMRDFLRSTGSDKHLLLDK